MKKTWNEFKAFINKGNVVDMAVGVVVATAFGKIVTALVNNMIMPAVSLITGRVSVADLAITIPSHIPDGEPIVIAYGLFLQAIIDFLIVSVCVFFFVKLINKMKRKKEETPPEPPKPTKEEELLTEIRDLLKEKN